MASKSAPSPGRTQAFLAFAYAVRMAVGLLVTSLLGRNLSTADFGFFAFVGSLVSVGTIILDLGTKSMSVREIAQRPERERPLLEGVIAWRFVVGFLILLAMGGLALCEPESGRRAVLLGTGLVIFLAAPASLQVLFQLRQSQGLPVLYGSLNQVLALLVFYLLIKWEVPGWAYGWVIVAREFLGILMVVWLARRLLDYVPRPGLGGRHMPAFLRVAVVLGFAVLAQALYFHVDVFFLKAMRGELELGIYSAAYRPVNMLLSMTGMICAPLLPVFSAQVRHCRATFRYLVFASSAQALTLGLMACSVGILLARDLLTLLYDDRYVQGPESAVLALRWLTLAFAGACMSAPLISGLLADGGERTLVRLGVLGLLANVIGNLILVPLYGFEAAAFTTMLTEMLIAVASAWALTSRCSERVQPISWHLVPIPAAVLGFIVFLIPGPPIVRVLLSAALFLLGAFMVLQSPPARQLRAELRAAAQSPPNRTSD